MDNAQRRRMNEELAAAYIRMVNDGRGDGAPDEEIDDYIDKYLTEHGFNDDVKHDAIVKIRDDIKKAHDFRPDSGQLKMEMLDSTVPDGEGNSIAVRYMNVFKLEAQIEIVTNNRDAVVRAANLKLDSFWNPWRALCAERDLALGLRLGTSVVEDVT